MGMRERRKKREARVVSAKRQATEHKRGGKIPLRVPSTLPQLQVGKEARTLVLDFVCWKAGKGNPHCPKGEAAFERTYFCHAKIGPAGDTVICNAKTFNKACPVCEYRNKLQQDPTPDEAKKKLISSLWPKERQVFLVVNREDKKKGVQLWEYSFKLFGEQLNNKINNARSRSEKKIREEFADPKVGSTLILTGLQKSGGGYTFVEFSDIEFKPRKKPLDSKVARGNPCVDDMIVPEDYKKLKELFFQNVKAEDDEDEEDERDEDEELDEEDEDGDDEDSNDDDDDEGDDDDEDDEDDDGEDSDDDEEGDDEDEDDDEGDSDEDDEDDSDVDEDDPPCEKGNLVKCKYKKKTYVGKVVAVNKADSIVRVKVEDREHPLNLEYDQVLKVLKKGGKMKVAKKGKKGKKRRDDDDDLPF